MSEPDSIELTEDEQDRHLGTGGTGVLSFCAPGGDHPESRPVSYGYDATERTFYFRLAVDPESARATITDQDVTFVVYDRTDDQWWSVVVTGRLVETTDESIATEALDGLDHVTLPFVDIFGRPPKDIPFEFYRLVPDELTSRRESPTTV